MKHITRKPILPLLLATIVLFGVCFMTLFQKGIEDDKQQVENLYQNTTLIFQILPGENTTTALRLDTYTGGKILALDVVAENYVRMECLYSLRTPESIPGGAKVYGTNNPNWMRTDSEIEISYAEGWDSDRFLSDYSMGIPCIMEVDLANRQHITYNDSFIIAGSPQEDSDPEKAPDLTMILVGTFEDTKNKLGKNALIVPESTFLAKPGLLYNSNMMYDCFYRVFTFELNPAYNKEYKQVQDQLEEILQDMSRFTIYSNARVLEQAIRPIERRLQIQQMLILPLAILFCVAVAVLAVLTALSFRTEVFLRFMWGEGRLAVYIKMLGSIAMIFLACSIALLPLIVLLAGKVWLIWAYRYFGLCAGVGILCTSVPLIQSCWTNLVKLYQSREG